MYESNLEKMQKSVYECIAPFINKGFKS